MPVKITVPEPACVKDPVPLSTFDTVKVPVSLNDSALLLTTVPEPSDPVAPALPICKVPPAMVVVVVEVPYVLAPVRITVAVSPEPPLIVRS